MKSTFGRDNKLLIGIIYESIREYDSFLHVKSIFSDKWYNFIVPKLDPDQLDWMKVQKICDSEGLMGVELSFYIPDHLHEKFQKHFNNKYLKNDLGSDFGLYYSNQEYNRGLGEMVEVRDTNRDEYLHMVKVCFPDWDNNQEYSKYFLKLQKVGTTISNFIYQVNKKSVGFGSVISSEKYALAYIHNTGIMPEFRRKGHFTDLIKLLTSYAMDCGASSSYALVEEGGTSHNALLKMGFITKSKYYLFGTS